MAETDCSIKYINLTTKQLIKKRKFLLLAMLLIPQTDPTNLTEFGK